jgi:uncharacterized protein YaeQ
MALSATRLEFKLSLANVDRNVEATDNLIIAQHPSETAEHVVLRVLAHCLLHEDRLEQGQGLADPEAADLWTRDLTGQTTTWVECGTADPDKLRKVLLHHSDIAVHAVLVDQRRHDDLVATAATWKKPRGTSTLAVWLVDKALVTALAAAQSKRQRWAVTIVGNHAYVEADGEHVDGTIGLTTPLAGD